MLMLSFELRLGPGANALPEHIGGALHGFVEGATLAHAPQLLGLLRPGGQNDAARFAVHAPPVGTTFEESVRFGLVLFGDASQAWPVLVRALRWARSVPGTLASRRSASSRMVSWR